MGVGGEAFAILDALVRQASEDAVQHAPAEEPGLVADIARIV